MFEKEAENTGRELAILWVNFHYDPAVKLNRHSLEWAYRAGYKDGAEFGYNKANEWHYVKDGEYPSKHLESYTLIPKE